MSFEFTSFEEVLEEFLPERQLAEVQRVLYGRPTKILELEEEVKAFARVKDFEIKGWSIPASPEESRPPRNVTIALVQNKVVLPTDAPILDQVQANHRRVGELIEAAGRAGANVVCLQEAWTMPYALSTRCTRDHRAIGHVIFHQGEAAMDTVCREPGDRSFGDFLGKTSGQASDGYHIPHFRKGKSLVHLCY